MKFSGKRKKYELNGVQTLALGFIVVIFLGSLILSMPFSSANNEPTNYLDALFTATSSVCVTGLVTVDTGTHWNEFGQIVIISLIQIGGLGFMSITVFIAALLGKKITLKERLYVQEAMNTFNIQGLVKMVKYVISFTFIVEFFGAIVLSTQFIPEYGMSKGVFYSIFHSISAFCNAGFDIIGNFSSLVPYSSNVVIILTLSLLIIIGGLGFTVIIELFNYRNTRRLSVHSKIVLVITGGLLVIGTVFIFLLEFKNYNTIGNMNMMDKLMNSFFSAVSPRTAGFNSIPVDQMTTASKFMTILLMFIGGSPGSTAGGLKTATFGIVILTLICVIKGRDDTEAFGRRFSKDLVYKSFALLMIAVGIVITVTLVLSITEYDQQFLDLLFEASSAFGTAGLTTGVTQTLSVTGKIIIIITMYCGRVGPLTVALALRHRKKKTGYRYPEGKILIG